MLIRPSARGIVIHNKQLLLIYRERDGLKFYAIPGGKVETGETLQETVIREVFEETAVVVTCDRFLQTFVNPKTGKEHHVFVCTYVSGVPKPNDPVELAKIQKDPSIVYRPEWISLSAVKYLKLHPRLVEQFLKAFVLAAD